MVFAGYHEHALDAKNRLAIPAKFRSGLDPERDGTQFVIVPGQPSDRLWLYPEKWFEGLVTRPGSELIPDDDRLRFDQGFFPLAAYADVDSQGRILIPERMLKWAKLGKEVVICGVRDHLEIRRRDQFEPEIEAYLRQYRELQLKARAAYGESRRQTGPVAGQP